MGKGLHQDVIDRAAVRPDDVAVVGQDRQLTYAQLDRQADLAAAELRELGVGPGDVVVVWAEKSPAVLVTQQAVLRLGAAYVPLDPQSSPQRVTMIARICGEPVVCVDQVGRRALTPLLGAEYRYLELLDDRPGRAEPHHAVAEPGHPAVVYFTSGSTGTPKAVRLSHANLRAETDWLVDALGVTARDRVACLPPLSFAYSVAALFPALRVGAAVHLVPHTEVYEPARLFDIIAEQQITSWLSVPSVMAMMLGATSRPAGPAPGTLRLVCFSGEAVSAELLRQVRAWAPRCELFNIFGSTETLGVLGHRIRPDEPMPDEVPLGRALGDVRAWALTDDGRIAATGESGELHIDGAAVMTGYLGEPDHTGPYQTGDVVRVRDDGGFGYVRRATSMTKVRGNRVDLEEVEAVARTHPAIAEAAAVVAGDGLVAAVRLFVVTADGAPVGPLSVKRHLATVLAPYAVPSEVVCVAELPRTASGKIDRQRLAGGQPREEGERGGR